MKKIGHRLRLRRVDLGITQKSIAQKIGVSEPTYSNIECGKTIPRLENFIKMCELLQITPNEALGWEVN